MMYSLEPDRYTILTAKISFNWWVDFGSLDLCVHFGNILVQVYRKIQSASSKESTKKEST